MIIIMNILIYGLFKVVKQIVFMGPEVVGMYEHGRDLSLAFGLHKTDLGWLAVLGLTAL